jgi:hypothetical protein
MSPACAWLAYRRSEPPCSRQAVRDGTRERIEAGICLVEHDRMLAGLSVIVSGKADGPWRGHPDARRTSEPKCEEK